MRLSKQLKNDIAELVVAKKRAECRAILDALNVREAEIADKLYESLYTKEERELMDKLGGRFFETTSRLALNFTEGGGYTSMRMSAPRPFAEDDRHRAVVSRDAHSETFKKWRQVEKERMEARKEVDRLYNQVFGVLNQITTVKKLRAAWPEIDAEITAAVGDQTTNAVYLPAVAVTELNEKLGIGKKSNEQ